MNESLHSCPDVQEWRIFLAGLVGGERAGELESHLSTCEACSQRLREADADDSLSAALRNGARIFEEIEASDWTIAADDTSVMMAGTSPSGRDEVWGGTVEWGEATHLAGYRILGPLGRGGNGRVYLAVDERLGRRVALKVILDDRRRDARDLARFEREACLLAQLNHPGIVRLYEVGSHRGWPYLALEYVEGGTLASQLQGRPIAADDAARTTYELAQALRHAHERGIIHRDLKPGNILLTPQIDRCERETLGTEALTSFAGRTKIADFGLARSIDAADLTRTGDVLGTPGYAAPELFDGRAVEADQSCDLYSLGAILYELLTGRAPFRGETAIETIALARLEDPLPPRRLRPALPKDLETICLKCLAREPARRYATAADLAEDLARVLDRRPIRARAIGTAERTARWLRRRPLVAGLVGLLATLLVAMTLGAAIYERSLRSSLAQTRSAERQAEQKRVEAEREARRADDNYDQAREALRAILLRTSDARWSGVPRLQQLRREQSEAALAFFRRIAEQHPETNKAKFDAAQAELEAGKLQLFLGRKDDGLAALRHALNAAEHLHRDNPQDVAAARLAAEASVNLGIQNVGEANVRLVEQGVARLARLAENSPEVSDLRNIHIDCLISLGAVYVVAMRYDEAERTLCEAIRLDDEWLQVHPDDLTRLLRRAKARINLSASYRQSKQTRLCREQHQLAESDYERLLKIDPADRATLEGLAVLRINGAYDLQAEERLDEAVAYVEQNIPMLEEALRREPEDAMYRDRLFRTYGVAATMYEAAGEKGRAADAWRRVVEFAPREEAALRSVQWVEACLNADDARQAVEAAEAAGIAMNEAGDDDLRREWGKILERLVSIVQSAAEFSEAERDSWGARFRQQAEAVGRRQAERNTEKSPSPEERDRTSPPANAR